MILRSLLCPPDLTGLQSPPVIYMEISPLLVFWLLLVGAALVTAIARYFPRYLRESAVVVLAVTWVLWWLAGRALPDIIITNSSSPFSLVWRLDLMSWQMIGVWLLLVTAVQVVNGVWPIGEGGMARGVGDPTNPQPVYLQPAYTLLAAAGLLPLLAGNLAAVLLSTTFLIGVWSGTLWLADPRIHKDITRLLPQAVWLMLSLLFVWLAAAFEPAAGDLEMSRWPRMATSSVLTAALLLIGYWPFHSWRRDDWSSQPGLLALIHAAPALAGIYLLVQLVQSSDVSIGYSLFLTTFGLVGLLVAVRRVWVNAAPNRQTAALALAQASLAGLALVWTSGQAAVTEARVLVLALGIFFLAERRMGQGFARIESGLIDALTKVVSFIALGGLAGLPLLAGFAGRSALYAAWLEDGRLVLVLVASLVQVLIVTAVTGRLLKVAPADSQLGESELNIGGLIGIGLLAISLISFKGLTNTPFVVWLAILSPFFIGIFLANYVRAVDDFGAIIRRAFNLDLPTAAMLRRVKEAVAWLETAVRDAAALLEGEGGLIWLLALLIVFLVAGGW